MTLMTPERFLDMMRKTPAVLEQVLRGVTQEQAQSIKDGPDGWSILEVVCHLSDYEAIFLERAEIMLEQDNADLPRHDHLAMVVEHRCNEQVLSEVLARYQRGRETLLEWFGARDPSDWERKATHHVFGEITMRDLVMHIGWHDLNHIEQIVHSMEASGEVGRADPR